MSTNKYMSIYDSPAQQRLYKSLVDGLIRQWGIDCVYIPRSSFGELDLLLGDDPLKKFDGNYPIEVLIMNVDSFDGPGDMFTKYGLVINKSIRLLMGNTAFQTATSGDLGVRPREGDVVYLRPFQALYEIKYVNQDKLFYAFGSRQFYGWELECEEFRMNSEEFDNVPQEVVDKVNSVTIAYLATMANSGTLTFVGGETVYQGANVAAANATGIVCSWNKPAGNLILRNITGIFETNTTTYGANSGAVYEMYSIEAQQEANEEVNNNALIRTGAGVELDTSESNPFGNPYTSNPNG